MGWTPAEVGRTGLAEFMAAWDGWRRFHIGEPAAGGPPSREEALALHAEIFGSDA